MALEIFNCDQGTDEWFQCRLGIPTASNFKTVLAKGEGKVRKTYMLKLAGEILTGRHADNFKNDDMARGNEMEPEARDFYAFTRDVELTAVGFCKLGAMGCSPDRFVGVDGGLEIKTAFPHILIEQLLRDDIPPEHVAQVQGTMMITGREWWDLMVYWPGMTPPVFRTLPDRAYQSNLQGEINRFNDELAAVVERVRAYGRREAA